jgi:Tfp pilus assembly protein PilF
MAAVGGDTSMTNKSRRQRLEEMLADDPTDAFLRYGLAMDYAGAGEDAAAAKCFAELIRLSPDYVPAYLQAGQVLVRLGRDDEARGVYQAGVTVAQRVGDAHAAGELQGFLDMLG